MVCKNGSTCSRCQGLEQTRYLLSRERYDGYSEETEPRKTRAAGTSHFVPELTPYLHRLFHGAPEGYHMMWLRTVPIDPPESHSMGTVRSGP
jgi:hypothetical protein